MIKDEILPTISKYILEYPDERGILGQIVGSCDEVETLTCRKAFTGHITCGAVIVNSENLVLRVKHRGLNKWLFPGGHIEVNDASLSSVALRETFEETGIMIEPPTKFGNSIEIPIQIDIHEIPESVTKKEPAHLHFDFRYFFRANDLTYALQDSEILEMAWIPMDQLPARLNERLILRLSDNVQRQSS